MPGVGSVGTTGNQDINSLLTEVCNRGGACCDYLVRVHYVHPELTSRLDLNEISSAILGSHEATRL
jgi:hypothetical protein